MTKMDWLHLLDALDDALEEFNELINEKEWYVSDVVDKLASGRQIVLQNLKEIT